MSKLTFQQAFQGGVLTPNMPQAPPAFTRQQGTFGNIPSSGGWQTSTPAPSTFKIKPQITNTEISIQNSVYPDGVPKLSTPIQATTDSAIKSEVWKRRISDLRMQASRPGIGVADAERLFNEADALEEKYFPESHQIVKLKEQIEEMKALKTSNNLARLDAAGHAAMASKERKDILKELEALRLGSKVSGSGSAFSIPAFTPTPPKPARVSSGTSGLRGLPTAPPTSSTPASSTPASILLPDEKEAADALKFGSFSTLDDVNQAIFKSKGKDKEDYFIAYTTTLQEIGKKINSGTDNLIRNRYVSQVVGLVLADNGIEPSQRNIDEVLLKWGGRDIFKFDTVADRAQKFIKSGKFTKPLTRKKSA